jgi:hypothetical protein
VEAEVAEDLSANTSRTKAQIVKSPLYVVLHVTSSAKDERQNMTLTLRIILKCDNSEQECVELPCPTEFCRNSGQCTVDNSTYRQLRPVCQCKEGFEGHHCEINKENVGLSEKAEKHARLCLHHDCHQGHCKVVGNKGICICNHNYFGPSCKEHILKCTEEQESLCKNNASCYLINPHTVMNETAAVHCNCAKDFVGQFCEHKKTFQSSYQMVKSKYGYYNNYCSVIGLSPGNRCDQAIDEICGHDLVMCNLQNVKQCSAVAKLHKKKCNSQKPVNNFKTQCNPQQASVLKVTVIESNGNVVLKSICFPDSTSLKQRADNCDANNKRCSQHSRQQNTPGNVHWFLVVLIVGLVIWSVTITVLFLRDRRQKASRPPLVVRKSQIDEENSCDNADNVYSTTKQEAKIPLVRGRDLGAGQL